MFNNKRIKELEESIIRLEKFQMEQTKSIQKLNNAGIKVIVLTGDNAAVTKCVCQKVNISTKKIVQ